MSEGAETDRSVMKVEKLTSARKPRQAAGPKYCPPVPKCCTCTQAQTADLSVHPSTHPSIRPSVPRALGSCINNGIVERLWWKDEVTE